MIHPAVGDGLAGTRTFLEGLLDAFPGLRAHYGEDAAVVDWPSAQVVCTGDSFIVDPIEFPGGDIGRLAICGVVNDLACRGAVPVGIVMNLVFGGTADSQAVERVLASAAAACREVGADLLGGDTKLMPQSDHDLIISAFGIGRLSGWATAPSLTAARAGDRLICTGPLGNHSIAVLSEREGLGFERVVSSDCRPLVGLMEMLSASFADSVVALRDLTRGGLGAALLDLASMSGHSVVAHLAEVPIDQTVRAACEMLMLDPLFLTNEGKALLVVRPEAAGDVLDAVRSLDASSAAVEIGEVIDPDRGGTTPVVCLEQDGERSVVVEPQGLPVPRLC